MYIFNSNSRETSVFSWKFSFKTNRSRKWWVIDTCLKLSFVRNLCNVSWPATSKRKLHKDTAQYMQTVAKEVGKYRIRERAEWLMICPLYRTRCLLLFCSPRKQTFCLFWVRKPHGEMRSRAGLAFLWPLSILVWVSQNPWCHLKQIKVWSETLICFIRIGNTEASYQGTWGQANWWRCAASVMFPFLMHLLNSYSKDTVTGSQWQHVVLKCLALLPPRGHDVNTEKIQTAFRTAFIIYHYYHYHYHYFFSF